MNPTPPPLPEDLLAVLKRMRLPYLRAAAPEVLATAKAQRWDPTEVLKVLLDEEVRGRDEATKAMRRKTAGLPAGKTFSSWRESDSSIPAPTQQALATLEWVGRAENLAVSGPDVIAGLVPKLRSRCWLRRFSDRWNVTRRLRLCGRVADAARGSHREPVRERPAARALRCGVAFSGR